jgi:hypothetical protein
MTIERRSCAGTADFYTISDFLTRHYQPGNRDGNWLQPVWEYAYTHPWFDESSVNRIGIWEDEGQVVGVATYESRLGEAFFHTRSTASSIAASTIRGTRPQRDSQAGKRCNQGRISAKT